jgi:hypothetical protein
MGQGAAVVRIVRVEGAWSCAFAAPLPAWPAAESRLAFFRPSPPPRHVGSDRFFDAGDPGCDSIPRDRGQRCLASGGNIPLQRPYPGSQLGGLTIQRLASGPLSAFGALSSPARVVLLAVFRVCLACHARCWCYISWTTSRVPTDASGVKVERITTLDSRALGFILATATTLPSLAAETWRAMFNGDGTLSETLLTAHETDLRRLTWENTTERSQTFSSGRHPIRNSAHTTLGHPRIAPIQRQLVVWGPFSSKIDLGTGSFEFISALCPPNRWLQRPRGCAIFQCCWLLAAIRCELDGVVSVRCLEDLNSSKS